MKRVTSATLLPRSLRALGACIGRPGEPAVSGAGIGAGVPADRIDTRWTGEAKQAVAMADDAADQRNRVIDVTVVKHSP
jgi:hypothetical protein